MSDLMKGVSNVMPMVSGLFYVRRQHEEGRLAFGKFLSCYMDDKMPGRYLAKVCAYEIDFETVIEAEYDLEYGTIFDSDHGRTLFFQNREDALAFVQTLRDAGHIIERTDEEIAADG